MAGSATGAPDSSVYPWAYTTRSPFQLAGTSMAYRAPGPIVPCVCWAPPDQMAAEPGCVFATRADAVSRALLEICGARVLRESHPAARRAAAKSMNQSLECMIAPCGGNGC